MKLINRTKGEHMIFPHILKTTEPSMFIKAILGKKEFQRYEGTENWEEEDEYEFEETETLDITEKYDL